MWPMGVPACAEEVVQELYSQGLQVVDCDEAGVMNPLLGRMVFLFMDDTTLVARTKAGLGLMTLTRPRSG